MKKFVKFREKKTPKLNMLQDEIEMGQRNHTKEKNKKVKLNKIQMLPKGKQKD